jgi:hypothetical protein
MFLEIYSLFLVLRLPSTVTNYESFSFRATDDRLQSLIALPNLLKNESGKFLYSSLVNSQLLQSSVVFTWKSYKMLRSIFNL